MEIEYKQAIISYKERSNKGFINSEVSEIKLSLLELHDKVSALTFMLDTFMKVIKGMVVEDMVVEEEVEEENTDEKKEEVNKEEAQHVEEEVEEEEQEEEKKEEGVVVPIVQAPPPLVKTTPSLVNQKLLRKGKKED